MFSNSTPSSDNTITVIAQTPSGNSKKLVVKLSQLVLIKKEEFEASLTEIKQESFIPPPVTTISSEEDMKLGELKVSKSEMKNFDFDRKYVVLDPCLKEQITEKYSDNKEIVTFRCGVCEKQFTTSSRYHKHLASHSSDEQHTCSLCGKVFRSLGMLRKHENSHQVARFVCEFCKKELASKHQLDIHIRRHKGEYSDKCAECGKEYYNRKAFRQHIESEHKGIRYTCLICGSILKNRRYWKDHMTKHTHPDLKRYFCQICNKFYSSKTALNGHMKIHSTERYECNICGKKSTQKAAHLVHTRLHTGEKNFVCEICGKNFVRKDMMQIHKRRVHELSKYQCEYCQQQFETEHHLLVHYHCHEEVQKNFACEFCPKKFIDVNFLRNHVNKIHIENKPDDVTNSKLSPKIRKRDEKIRCLHCDKFILKSEVKSHQCINKMDNIEFKSLMDYSFEKFEDVVPYEYDTHNEIACVGNGDIMYEFKDDIINSDGIVEVCGANEDGERFGNNSKTFAS
ncbi:Zinc finger, C2H2 type [Popillia japonica]|uniref:Zinc finger, C2H2 type n=1 Tax=Popillia japonica TaxID=7064 RepID=A0AAW1LQR8_POPJA